MPRFFFNIYDDAVTVDDNGVLLPDVAAAREEALRVARELICNQVRQGTLNLRHRIEIEDEERRPVLTLPFGAAIALEDSLPPADRVAAKASPRAERTGGSGA